MNNYKLQIPNPEFDSSITELIMQLEVLKTEKVYLDVNPDLFFQLNKLFHSIESLQSARIEGNRTTLSDYFKVKLDDKIRKNENIEEIINIENAIDYINRLFDEDKNIQISNFIIKELHSILTKDLVTEGSHTPGNYRKTEVLIKNSKHTPPMAIKVQEYMDELIDWINMPAKIQEKPLKVAIAHHRFTWIHPFDNGNGRMARLLTYFLLRQYGYRMSYLMNLSAIFCIDRKMYFDMLEKADFGDRKELLNWCEYVLRGLNIEIAKMKKLLDKKYFMQSILEPAFQACYDRNLISSEELKILVKTLTSADNIIMLKDIRPFFKDKTDRQINFILKQMTNNKLLQKNEPNSKKYLLNLYNDIITYELIKKLEDEKFIVINKENK